MRGHVRRRGQGWAFILDTGRDEDGKRKQKWFSGYRTEKEAQNELTQKLGELAQGTYTPPTKITVRQFFDETWLPGIPARMRANSAETYRSIARCHIIPRLGSVQLQKLTPAMLNSMYASLLKEGGRKGQGLSPRSVGYVHTCLTKALGDAVKWQLLQRNPAAGATPPKQGRKEMHAWTAPQLRKFLDSLDDEPWGAAYFLAATTGVRRSELLGIPWGAVDLDAGRVQIRQGLTSTRYVLHIDDVKRSRSRRTIALDPTTVDVLTAHRARQLRERMALGLGRPGPEDLVFCAADTTPIRPDAFTQRFDRLVKASGLPRITLHGLRHTHATLALQAGVPAKVVADRLGHSSVAMTLDVYSHAIPAMEEEAAAKISGLVYAAG